MGIVEYLEAVSKFWESASLACERCDFNDPDRGCDMLYARSIPNGNCLGLLERDGIKQPPEYEGPLNPSAAWPFPRKRPPSTSHER